MSFLRIICLVAFILSLPLRWWQNTWFGTSPWQMPRIVRSGLNQLVVLASIFLLTYGGIVGVWYFYGWWLAVIAFLLRWWIGSRSWQRTFDQEVRRTADYYYEEMLRAKSHQGDPKELRLSPRLPLDVATWDDETMRREAYSMGQDHVREVRLK